MLMSRSVANNELKAKDLSENPIVDPKEYDNENENIITINNVLGTDRDSVKNICNNKSCKSTTNKLPNIGNKNEEKFKNQNNNDAATLIEDDKVIIYSKSTPLLETKSKLTLEEPIIEKEKEIDTKSVIKFNSINNIQNVLNLEAEFNSNVKVNDTNFFSENLPNFNVKENLKTSQGANIIFVDEKVNEEPKPPRKQSDSPPKVTKFAFYSRERNLSPVPNLDSQRFNLIPLVSNRQIPTAYNLENLSEYNPSRKFSFNSFDIQNKNFSPLPQKNKKVPGTSFKSLSKNNSFKNLGVLKKVSSTVTKIANTKKYSGTAISKFYVDLDAKSKYSTNNIQSSSTSKLNTLKRKNSIQPKSNNINNSNRNSYTDYFTGNSTVNKTPPVPLDEKRIANYSKSNVTPAQYKKLSKLSLDKYVHVFGDVVKKDNGNVLTHSSNKHVKKVCDEGDITLLRKIPSSNTTNNSFVTNNSPNNSILREIKKIVIK